MIPYMAGKLATNSSRLTRGLVKHVPGRGYFRAIPSQTGTNMLHPRPPPPIVELVSIRNLACHRRTVNMMLAISPNYNTTSRRKIVG